MAYAAHPTGQAQKLNKSGCFETASEFGFVPNPEI